MGLRPLWVLGLFALASLGQAQEIHKCAGQDGVTYQSVPCPAGQQEQAFASIARNQNRQEQAPPSATRSENARDAYTSRSREANRYAGTPFAATTLFIGMTDTQVLNLTGCYKDAAEERRFLYFENGRLVAREEEPVPSMQARLTSEQELLR